jgi:hypothetical protein
MASIETLGTSSATLARVQEAWWPFRAAAASIGIGELDRPTPAGWTYKDLLAHVAAWEEATATRLARFRGNGAPAEPPGEQDAFNAQVVHAWRSRAAGAVFDALDESHARLVGEVGALADDQLGAHEGWAARIIASNTYDHYEEHRDELFAVVPRTPQDLLERMDPAWRRFRRAVSHIGLLNGAQRSPSGMTYRGLLGHVAYWLESVPVELPMRLAGRRNDPPDVDAVNAQVAAEADTRPSHEVTERLDRAYSAVRELVVALPADVPFLAVRLVAGETYDHFREHQRDVEAARPKTAAATVERIEQVWRPFRAAIRGRGRSGLGERIAEGLAWTFADLVAHAAAWMEQVPATLEQVRAGQEPRNWDDQSIRAFNERATESRRLVGAEALLDELDTAYRLLVSAAKSLSNEEISQGRSLGVVAFYSYLHWEEHFGDLGIHS